MRDVKVNKKCFYEYLSTNRRTNEKVGLLLNGAAVLMLQCMENAKVLDSVFTTESGFLKSRNPKIRGKAYPWWKRIGLENR